MATQAVCIAGIASCHECIDETRCSFCRDSRYLYNNACITSCPEGTISVGTGSYRRECVVPTTECT